MYYTVYICIIQCISIVYIYSDKTHCPGIETYCAEGCPDTTFSKDNYEISKESGSVYEGQSDDDEAPYKEGK